MTRAWSGGRARAPFTVVLAFALIAGPLWLNPPVASAHATLERSDPAPEGRLAAEPRQVVLVFDEAVDVSLGQAIVLGPTGATVSTGYTQPAGGKVVTIGLRPGAGQGPYVVSYRVVSLDTHPVSGGFFFHVGPQTAAHRAGADALPPVASRSIGAGGEDVTVDGIYAACRYAGFVGLLLLVGGVVFLLVLPGSRPLRRVGRLAWLGFALVTAGSMGELVLQAPYAAGTPLTAITGTGFQHVVDTRFGTAHLLRLALLALVAPALAALCGGAPRRPRPAAACALLLGTGLAVTWAYSGHPGTTTPIVSVPSDVVHLLAVTVWVGGLIVLATAVLPLADAGQLRTALPRWSALALVCVAALVITGIVQTLLELDGWARLVDSDYGRLLLAKVGLLVVVLMIASYSRRWVRRWFAPPRGGAPRTAGNVDPSRAEVSRIRRAVATESGLTLAAVAVAAMLIEAAPHASSTVGSPTTARRAITRPGAYVAAVRRGALVIHLKVDPAVAGIQYIYLRATRPGGRRVPVREWTLTLSNSALGLDHVIVPLIADFGVGHHFVYGSFTMPAGGIWTVEATARTSDIDETIVTRQVAVRP